MASAHASTSNLGASTSQSGGSATANRPQLVSSVSQTGDIALWLHNKLGTSNDLWSGMSFLNNIIITTYKT